MQLLRRQFQGQESLPLPQLADECVGASLERPDQGNVIAGAKADRSAQALGMFLGKDQVPEEKGSGSDSAWSLFNVMVNDAQPAKSAGGL